MSHARKPILCLDFDGVLHSYSSGWQGAAIIPDPIVPGSVEFLHGAVERFRVAIYSSRSGQPGGIDAMRGWLTMQVMAAIDDRREAEHVLGLIEWPTEKPAAMITIDDRAVTFMGVWPTLDEIAAFQPWNKKPALAAPVLDEPHRPAGARPEEHAMVRALQVIDALPDAFRPSDETPLRDALPGSWPTIGDLRDILAALIAQEATDA